MFTDDPDAVVERIASLKRKIEVIATYFNVYI